MRQRSLATIDGNKKDPYGRIVGKVLVNGTDCNLRQIKLGMAWHYKKYENE
ncbi:MAG: thermonuclease family protein [Methylophilaceae bacterium]